MQKNTGALYTAEGQVIVSIYNPKTGDAWFNDQSRGIEGYVKITPNLDPFDAWADIWHAYTTLKYEGARSIGGVKGRKVLYWNGNDQREVKIDLVDRLS